MTNDKLTRSSYYNMRTRVRIGYATMCDQWLDLDSFVEDMGLRPEGTSLDRIDNDKGYHKDNCRWSTHQEQMENRGVFKSNKLNLQHISKVSSFTYRVKIVRNGIRFQKTFPTLKQAIEARDLWITQQSH